MNPRPKKNTRLLVAAKAALSGLLLAAALCALPAGSLAESLRQADARWLALSALLLVAGGFAGAYSWFCVARAALPALTYAEAAACHWSGMFFNTFLPSNVGGDAVKGYLVVRRQGHTGHVVFSLLVDRLLNLGVLAAIGLFSWLLLAGHADGALLFLGTLLLFTALAPALSRRACQRLRRPPPDGLAGRAAQALAPLFELAAAPERFFPTLLAAVASQALKTGHNAFVVLALGLKIPALCLWTVIPLFGMVSALPVSVGGLGVRELTAHGVAGPLLLDRAQLVSLSLAGYLMVTLVNMLGAIPFVLRGRK